MTCKKQISNCVGDFNIFMEFIKNENPVLSAKLGVLVVFRT